MNKICEILGTPNQNDWPEGYALAKEIKELMLNFNPAKRLSAVKCLQHPFCQCYEVLKFYGIRFNNREDREERENNEDKKGNINNNFSLSVNNNEQFRGDLNDSFGNSTEINNNNKNHNFKNGSLNSKIF